MALAEDLNRFFACFETLQKPSSASSTFPLTVKEHDVSWGLRAINPRKAAGPDSARESVQSMWLFITICNHFPTQAVFIPSSLISAAIIPIIKKLVKDCLSNYHTVSHMPIILKCFERLVLHHIKACLPFSFDPHQSAYQVNRSTEDAIV